MKVDAITTDDLEAAELVLVVDEQGRFRWKSESPATVVSSYLRTVARCLAEEAGVQVCRVCGCTDLAACSPPCSWVEADLCSSHGRAT